MFVLYLTVSAFKTDSALCNDELRLENEIMNSFDQRNGTRWCNLASQTVLTLFP